MEKGGRCEIEMMKIYQESYFSCRFAPQPLTGDD